MGGWNLLYGILNFLILAAVGILTWYVGLPALSEYVKGAV